MNSLLPDLTSRLPAMIAIATLVGTLIADILETMNEELNTLDIPDRQIWPLFPPL